jgi:alpha-glucosidase
MKVSMLDQIHDEKSSINPSSKEGSLIHARLPQKDINWWRSAVLYQVYPRSFCDARGDGIGDIKGLIKRLTEIKSLGVDVIWICPFFKSPMEDFGYDIEDYCAVDPLFGQQEDVYELIKTAHTLGLRVLIDLVISHTSERHPWFKESRLSRDSKWSDYYVWADPLSDGSPPNNWLSIFGGSAWKWDICRRQYYLHNFLVF